MIESVIGKTYLYIIYIYTHIYVYVHAYVYAYTYVYVPYMYAKPNIFAEKSNEVQTNGYNSILEIFFSLYCCMYTQMTGEND